MSEKVLIAGREFVIGRLYAPKSWRKNAKPKRLLEFHPSDPKHSGGCVVYITDTATFSRTESGTWWAQDMGDEMPEEN